MFRDRDDAALQLAERLKGREFRDPLVLAIPRGGVAVGAGLARELGADLDVVLAHKLRAPGQPELAVGAISEDGELCLNHHAEEVPGLTEEYLARERRYQLGKLQARSKLLRRARPVAPIANRSVIVTDDGIATGSTMIAALRVIGGKNPHDVVVAVPVASPDRLAEIRRHGDEVICVLKPRSFWAIGQFYEDFAQLDDDEVLDLLRSFAPAR